MNSEPSVRVSATLTYSYEVPLSAYGEPSTLAQIREIEEGEALGKLRWAVDEIGLRPTVDVALVPGDALAQSYGFCCDPFPRCTHNGEEPHTTSPAEERQSDGSMRGEERTQ